MDMTQDAVNSVMNQSMTLAIEGTRMMLTLTGKGAVRVAAMLAAIMKEQHRTKGAVRLKTLIRAGGSQEVFTLPQEQLKAWAAAAKKYEILYTVIKGPADDGMVDLWVRPEDAARINRIVERLGIGLVHEASVTSEPAPEQELSTAVPTAQADTVQRDTDQILSEILAPPEQIRDDTGRIIEDSLDPDVPEDEFNALFQDDSQPAVDIETLQDPQTALLNEDPSSKRSGMNLTGDAKQSGPSEASTGHQQGSKWTMKRVNEEWPLSHAKNEFSSRQLFEIHQGFQNGLSVEQIETYAKPNLSPYMMEVLRKDLRPSVAAAIDRIKNDRAAGRSAVADVAEKIAEAGKEL